MKSNEKEIWDLSRKTSFSYKKCEKVLLEHNNDVDAAYEHLMQLKKNPIEVITDSAHAFVTGERGRKFIIYDNEKVVLSLPLIFPLLFLFFFNILSWVIALFILLIVLFNMNIKIESSAKRKKAGVQIFDVMQYNKQKGTTKDENKKNNDEPHTDYHEITIE